MNYYCTKALFTEDYTILAPQHSNRLERSYLIKIFLYGTKQEQLGFCQNWKKCEIQYFLFIVGALGIKQ